MLERGRDLWSGVHRHSFPVSPTAVAAVPHLLFGLLHRQRPQQLPGGIAGVVCPGVREPERSLLYLHPQHHRLLLQVRRGRIYSLGVHFRHFGPVLQTTARSTVAAPAVANPTTAITAAVPYLLLGLLHRQRHQQFQGGIA